MDAIAATLIGNPDIKKVEIQGFASDDDAVTEPSRVADRFAYELLKIM